MKEVSIFTVTSLGIDLADYSTRFPIAWRKYKEAVDVLVTKPKGSLVSGATIYDEENSGFICCTHYIPGSHSRYYEYLVSDDFKETPNSMVYPKVKGSDCLEGVEITRYTDYEAYYSAISRIRYLAELGGFDKIKLLWSVDGELGIIEAINKEIFKNSQIEIEICLEDQYWRESLLASVV